MYFVNVSVISYVKFRLISYRIVMIFEEIRVFSSLLQFVEYGIIPRKGLKNSVNVVITSN